MDRVNKICNHPLWRESLEAIGNLEKERVFCKHDMTHFLDVARIAYIENLEKALGIPREWIYATALLHDIGRHMQYREGIPHDIASMQIAEDILKDCGFEEQAQEEILHAIGAHRVKDTVAENDLAGVLYRADKKSRNCLFCPAYSECNWSDEKKNMLLSR